MSDIADLVKGRLIGTSFLWPTGSEWHCKCCERQSHNIICYDQQLVSDIPHFVKSSFITLSHLIFSYDQQTVRVTLYIMWKASSDHLLWPTGSKWAWTPCERQSHHIFSYDQQLVSDTTHFMKSISSHLFLWPTVCEWHCTSCEKQSNHMFCYDQ